MVKAVIRPEIPSSRCIEETLKRTVYPEGLTRRKRVEIYVDCHYLLQQKVLGYLSSTYCETDDLPKLLQTIQEVYGVTLKSEEVLGLTPLQVAGRIQKYFLEQQKPVTLE